MTPAPPNGFSDFRAFSARLGSDPLQIQGPGGNTSIKDGSVMWIKASGTQLAHADSEDVFVPVDLGLARAEALGETGDGSCKNTGLDPENSLGPSIETTFHAALDWPVVAHTHSVATLVHAISGKGRDVARDKLKDLEPVFVSYAKPGLPLTIEILARKARGSRVFILENHGLIVCGDTVAQTEALIKDVENRLAISPRAINTDAPPAQPPTGFRWAQESWIAQDPRTSAIARAGSYYPDHVVFLGQALPDANSAAKAPVVLVDGVGIAIRLDARPAQKAMLRCLSDILRRLPDDWDAIPIGVAAEAALLDWDAEKYRQALAERQ